MSPPGVLSDARNHANYDRGPDLDRNFFAVDLLPHETIQKFGRSVIDQLVDVVGVRPNRAGLRDLGRQIWLARLVLESLVLRPHSSWVKKLFGK